MEGKGGLGNIIKGEKNEQEIKEKKNPEYLKFMNKIR